MTNVKQKREIYKCEVCGNVIEVISVGGGELVCCEKPMVLLEEKAKDEGKEKHVPIIEKGDGFIKVKVGEVPHPMEENHYIQWIDLYLDGRLCQRKELFPGEKPEAEFVVNSEKFEEIEVREFCNVHGLWFARKE